MRSVNTQRFLAYAQLPRVICAARSHYAEAEALYLLGKQPGKIILPCLILITLQENRTGKMIDRVGYLAEQTGKTDASRHTGIRAHHGPVGLVLRHAYVLHSRIQSGHAARGRKRKQVADKQVFFLAYHDLRQRLAVRRKHLVQFQFIAGTLGLVGVKDLDFRKLMSQQLQRQQRRAAHVAKADECQDKTGFFLPLPRLQHSECVLETNIQNPRPMHTHKIGQFTEGRTARCQAADCLKLGKFIQIMDIK